MTEDFLRYDRMVERALRGVVREAIGAVAARKVLPGDHHFFITFVTGFAGVQVPEHLKKQYPEEMTIVLQHQFYDLEVKDDVLGVTLSFNSKLERLKIPLEAITTFADPDVSFALQFQANIPEVLPAKPADPTATPPTTPPPSGSGEVVALDAFRKKQQE